MVYNGIIVQNILTHINGLLEYNKPHGKLGVLKFILLESWV